MKSNYTEEDISKYIFKLFKEELKEDYIYHNFAHTQQTVAIVKKLSEECKLSAQEQEDLIFAAWFHDTGYSTNP